MGDEEARFFRGCAIVDRSCSSTIDAAFGVHSIPQAPSSSKPPSTQLARKERIPNLEHLDPRPFSHLASRAGRRAPGSFAFGASRGVGARAAARACGTMAHGGGEPGAARAYGVRVVGVTGTHAGTAKSLWFTGQSDRERSRGS
mmetsp:Transcript_54019/g.143447  ORF Transcript_54019/g.143447 Transcript_54019/m.143447 type:complete len:144 (+) Transcript_54019:455-886(+)